MIKVNIIKSSVKVLWIDTWMVWRLNISTWQKIAKLVVEKKLKLVDTGQLAEMQERYEVLNNTLKSKVKIYQTIVGENISTDHVSFLSREVEKAMTAFVNRSDKIEFGFNDLFDDSIMSFMPFFEELIRTTGIKIGTPRNFKRIGSEIVKDWKIIRANAKKSGQKIESRRKDEINGMHEALINSLSNPIRKKNLFDHYFKIWKNISGDKDDKKMLEFFKSEYYSAIPYEDIRSWIISDLVIGNEELKPSDYFDIVIISMILPFADFMVVDGSMRNRIKDKLKLIRPKGKYDSQLVTQSEFNVLLNKM